MLTPEPRQCQHVTVYCLLGGPATFSRQHHAVLIHESFVVPNVELDLSSHSNICFSFCFIALWHFTPLGIKNSNNKLGKTNWPSANTAVSQVCNARVRRLIFSVTYLELVVSLRPVSWAVDHISDVDFAGADDSPFDTG